MHIALYSPTWPPSGAANGIVSYVSTVSNYLMEHGHRVSILSDGALHTENDGAIPLPSIAQLRKHAVISVIASRTGTFCRALVEGVAMGCPMISTDWLSSDEIVGDGETAFLTPAGDPDAVAQRAAWLLDHPEIAADIGAAGTRHWRGKFSIETIGRHFVERYGATVRTI